MREIKVAKRYASALFQFAEESKKLDTVFADMSEVASVCKENKEFKILLSSPIVASSKKISVLEAIFSSNVDELTLRYLLIITSKGRENILFDIALQYQILYKEHKGIISLNLKTAVALQDAEKKKIISLLKEATKATAVEINETVDANLIGGFVLSWDDMQVDASLQRRLIELKKDFESNVYSRSI